MMWTRSLYIGFAVSALALGACATTAASAAIAKPSNSPVAAGEAVPIPRIKPEPQKILTPAEKAARAERFEVWKAAFAKRTIAKGYAPDLVSRTIGRAKINPLALDRDRTQPEFTTPIWDYVDKAASADRIARGKTKLRETDATFKAISARYNVSPYILTAIWGLESSYGRILGNHDIIDALSTFAFEGRRSKFGQEQLFATLDLLASGAVREDQLTGAWAGAMGMTQFIPTTFRDYAVDFDGDGNKDLWKNPADALGSAAHYLNRFGWRGTEPVYAEVTLPARFDYSVADGRKMSVNDWVGLGVAPVNGQRFSAEAGFLEAKLLVPAGARGPAILTFKNFDVIKRYNNATSYALGIATLAEAFRDRPTIVTPWPKGDTFVRRTDLKSMQKKLTALGYDTGGADGIIGPNTRRAIRAWQKANGLVADGYVEAGLYAKIMASR